MLNLLISSLIAPLVVGVILEVVDYWLHNRQ